jgi:hypothetical protein
VSRGCRRIGGRPAERALRNGVQMSVLLYVVLTVVVFSVLGLVQKLVEGL